MRRTCLWIAFALLCVGARGQDFSNRGKDFWLCFPSHVPNERDGITYYAKMSLFITGDRNTSGTASIPGILTKTFSVIAGQVTEIDIPYSSAHIDPVDAEKVIRKGIHVQVDPGKPPVVLYAHIYAGFRSAASLILPVAVLGKKYYSMNAPQVSISGSKSQFVVVAVEDNTTVLITPVRNGVKDVPITVQLPQAGDLYEFQDNADLSGSVIESVSSNTEGCKKIAVFSGSSAIHISAGPGCTVGESYDPLYQQLYPVNAWGKKYGFIPFQNYKNGNPYRIIASEDNTSITVNGFTVGMLNAGQCFPDNSTFGIVETNGIMISADKPVSVAQFAQSSSCTGLTPPPGTGYGDPDMVLLNPIEQNVNDITVFSSQKENIFSDSKFINVLIKDQATSSFTINGVAPTVTWGPVMPAGSGYSYARIQLPGNLNAYTLKADSAFNAIAYGFGDFESYAYSAGTNVKDLYRTLTIENEFGNGTIPIGCSNSSFRISVTFPYQPQKISFNFYGLFPDEVINTPVPVESFTVNGKTVYRYRLNNNFTINNAGIFPLTVIAQNNTNTGCDNGLDEIDYEINIVDKPEAEWTYAHSGCLGDAVVFTDASNSKGNTFTKWIWDFGDHSTSQQQSPAYHFASANTWTVKHWAVTNIGCGTDTVSRQIAVTNMPVAAFSTSANACANTTLLFSDLTSFTGNGNITSWMWDFGDNIKDTLANNSPLTHIYQSDNTFMATLQVQTNSGCKSLPVQKQVIVHPVPIAAFEVPAFCMPAGTGQFVNTSTIKNNAALASQWDFGDGNSATTTDPLHQYKSVGPFNVKLTVTSADGCIDDSVVVVSSIYPQSKLQINAIAENCLGDVSLITVKTKTGEYGLSDLYWSENVTAPFADTVIQANQDECKLPLIFNTRGNQSVRVFGTSQLGCYTDTVTVPVYINDRPDAVFKISSPLCDRGLISFTDISASNDGAITKWHWDFGNGIQSDQQHPQQVFSTGNYPVTLLVQSTKGCNSAPITLPLVISPLPLPVFEVPGACAADPFIPFINKSTIADHSENSFRYQWLFNDPNATVQNPNTSTQKDPRHRYATAGEYAARLQVTSGNGCVADTTIKIIVNGTKPKATFSLSGGNELCNNKPVILLDESTVDVGNIIQREIYWDYDNDPLIHTTDNNLQPGKTYSYQYPGAETDKTYRIRYVVYSGMSCLQQVDSFITVKRTPVIRFDPLDGVCENVQPFTVSVAQETSGVPGSGVYAGPGISADGLFSPSIAKPGIHTIIYTYTGNNGCATAAQQPIEVFTSPIANAGPDKATREGNPVRLEGTGMGEGIQFQWGPSTNIDNPRIATPVVTPSKDITYTLTVVSARGCKDTDEMNVKVISKINVPNAFTPDNNSKNDTWKIPFLELFDNCSVQVFNRWGQKVFQSKGYSRPWDGTLNGQPLPSGSYIYIIDLKNGQTPLKGLVNLLR